MEKESKGAEIQLTISWDVTEFAPQNEDLKGLLKSARITLYEFREGRRNKATVT